MRVAVGFLAGLLIATAWAADNGNSRTASAEARIEREIWMRAMELETRARELYPRRRDTPMRYANMTDDEVREVQVIARKYKMAEFVNISPVVTGCPCEEGAGCTEQVYITSNVGERTTGLQLSRRRNLWTVGVVQKWWLEFAALLARESKMSYREFSAARHVKLLEFPQCLKSEEQSTQVAENTSTK